MVILLDMFEEFGVKAVDEVADNRQKKNVWAVVESITQKKTKNNKPYLAVTVSGMSDKEYFFRVWNQKRDDDWSEGNVLIFSLDYNQEWGYNVTRNSRVLRVTK